MDVLVKLNTLSQTISVIKLLLEPITPTNAPPESTVKAMMPYWYRPNITRDEAIDFVRHLEPGSFIVRDSQTVSGGYALTIKVSGHLVRQRRKLAEGESGGVVKGTRRKG